VGSPDRVHINCGDFKVGFDVGSVANAKWLAEFDWLFGARDDAVHHSEELRPILAATDSGDCGLECTGGAYLSGRWSHEGSELLP
jgi:hypothetical protein